MLQNQTHHPISPQFQLDIPPELVASYAARPTLSLHAHDSPRILETHIEQIDRTALLDGDDDAAIAPLQHHLMALTPSDLELFEEHLSQCLYALDGQTYANESGESDGSDDAFLYARCFVVAQGQQRFEATLLDPTLMPKTLEGWCEALLHAHRDAWATITGKDESEWAFDASVSYESGSNEQLWPR